jgi:hypothetical protein
MADNSIITCLAWIRKGFAKATPLEEEITEKEINAMKSQVNKAKAFDSEPGDEKMHDLELDKYDEENGIPPIRAASICQRS